MEATFNWVIVDLKTTSPRILPCRLLSLVGCKNRWLFTRMLTADQARDNFVDTLLNNNNIHLSILRIGIEFSEISLPVNTAFQLIHLPYLLNVQIWSRSDFVCSSLLNKVNLELSVVTWNFQLSFYKKWLREHKSRNSINKKWNAINSEHAHDIFICSWVPSITNGIRFKLKNETLPSNLYFSAWPWVHEYDR